MTKPVDKEDCKACKDDTLRREDEIKRWLSKVDSRLWALLFLGIAQFVAILVRGI